MAAKNGNDSTITLLYSLNANVNAKDRIHRSPLYLAVLEERKSSVELLINLGAFIDEQNNVSQCNGKLSSLSVCSELILFSSSSF